MGHTNKDSLRLQANRKKHDQKSQKQNSHKQKPEKKEIGGRQGPEPTRYGDWEKNGLISDF